MWGWVAALAASAQAGPMGPWLDEPAPIEAVVAIAQPACAAGLEAAAQLPDRPELYARWNPDRAWGTPYLVDALQEAAERMAGLAPTVDPIAIGDLSREDGGDLPGHRTHDTGRDADIGLFLEGGRQAEGGAFVAATPKTLDAEATWYLIESLLQTERVQYILLDQSLIGAVRTWLAEERGADPVVLDRIFPPAGSLDAEGVVLHAPNHRDHLHVRVRCAAPEGGRS